VAEYLPLRFLTQHLVSRKRATPSKSSASSIARSEWSEAASSVIPPDVVTLSEAHKAAIVETAALMAQQGLAITMQMYRVS
jgi:hypothetical protein